jgi:bacterioferritin-associated ferredoxin
VSGADDAGEHKSAEGAAEHPDLIQLGLRRPTLGARARARVAKDPNALTELADRVGRSAREGRVACECEDVLVAEITRAIDEGARSLAQIALRTGLGTGICGGARCLDPVALHLAARCGRPTHELRAEAAALVRTSERPGHDPGPDRGLARVSLAYARLGDDVSVEAQDDDEPEVVVETRRGRR